MNIISIGVFYGLTNLVQRARPLHISGNLADHMITWPYFTKAEVLLTKCVMRMFSGDSIYMDKYDGMLAIS